MSAYMKKQSLYNNNNITKAGDHTPEVLEENYLNMEVAL